MRRKAVLVTAVGTDATGRPWCTLNESFMRPGDKGWIGPFALVEVRHSSDGRLLHFLKPGADPYVGELLALIQINSDTSAHIVVSRDKVSTQRKHNLAQRRDYDWLRECETDPGASTPRIV